MYELYWQECIQNNGIEINPLGHIGHYIRISNNIIGNENLNNGIRIYIHLAFNAEEIAPPVPININSNIHFEIRNAAIGPGIQEQIEQQIEQQIELINWPEGTFHYYLNANPNRCKFIVYKQMPVDIRMADALQWEEAQNWHAIIYPILLNIAVNIHFPLA